MKKNTALVLSGGGALGMAHLGILKNLEQDYNFDFITGVSAGAIIGAGIAVGKTAQEIKNIILETSLFNLSFDLSSKNFGIIEGEKIHKLLEKIYENKSFEDLETQLYIGATDFSTGKFILINKGKIADAVRASLSVPVVFEPFFHPEIKKFLVDGGLSKNFPIEVAIEKYTGKKIIGVNVTALKPLPKDFGEEKFFKNKDLVQYTQRSFQIFFKNQLSEIKDPRVEIIEPDLTEFSSITFRGSKLKKIMKKGEEV